MKLSENDEVQRTTPIVNGMLDIDKIDNKFDNRDGGSSTFCSHNESIGNQIYDGYVNGL